MKTINLEKELPMNYNTLVFLLNKECRAVRATYEDGGKKELFKTFLTDLQVDDLILVESGTRHGMTVCKVTEIDAEVDLDSSDTIRWAIQKVDADQLKALRNAEDASVKGIRKIELDKKREAMALAITEDGAKLTALPLATIGQKVDAA